MSLYSNTGCFGNSSGHLLHYYSEYNSEYNKGLPIPYALLMLNIYPHLAL